MSTERRQFGILQVEFACSNHYNSQYAGPDIADFVVEVGGELAPNSVDFINIQCESMNLHIRITREGTKLAALVSSHEKVANVSAYSAFVLLTKVNGMIGYSISTLTEDDERSVSNG